MGVSNTGIYPAFDSVDSAKRPVMAKSLAAIITNRDC